MPQLGKSLAFYLKYPAEMFHLYERPESDDQEPDFAGLVDAKHVREMARAVGTAADQQAVDFLKACAEGIESYFRTLGNVKIAAQATPRAILRNWTWYARCEVASVPDGWFNCGVSILKKSGAAILCANAKPGIDSIAASPHDQGGSAVPWLWRKGGRPWDQRVLSLLGDRAHSGPEGGLVEGGGSVALPTVPLLTGQLSRFDVDRDQLVEKVVQAFKAITSSELEAISLDVGEADRPGVSDSGGVPVPRVVAEDWEAVTPNWPSLAQRWKAGEHPPKLAREVKMKWEELYTALVAKGLLTVPGA